MDAAAFSVSPLPELRLFSTLPDRSVSTFHRHKLADTEFHWSHPRSLSLSVFLIDPRPQFTLGKIEEKGRGRGDARVEGRYSSRVFRFVGRKGVVPWILLGRQSGSRQSVEFSRERIIVLAFPLWFNVARCSLPERRGSKRKEDASNRWKKYFYIRFLFPRKERKKEKSRISSLPPLFHSADRPALGAANYH